MAEHKYAEVLRAIADGKPVEFMYEGYDGVWYLYSPESDSFHLRDDIQWRVKPKEKVKKWRWAPQRPSGQLSLTALHYADAVEFYKFCDTHQEFDLVEKVSSTMIEVDAE